ncbi:50S ribosomal protein L29 [Candidatus Woesearchaeota archaeon CG_4_10_14_0_8_um_filter_47_5]|nr:MAG: 50S ribosomal protein L29 [Candidatus Woesearchaeota archaeon CG_4_10_14_0_8_um_filter_47_5]
MRITTKELETMGPEAIKAKLTEMKKESIKLNAQVATGTTPKSPGLIRRIKKDIARIHTYTTKKTMERNKTHE